MRLLKKMISAFLVVCMVISMVPMAALATETDSTQSVEGRIIMDQSIGQGSVWIDGVEYAVQSSRGSHYVDLPAGATPGSMVTYSYHVGDSDDVHTQYPVGMQVWALNKNADGSYTPEKVEELNNILQYSGSSIRITGNKGIRMITSIEQNKKNDLTSGGLGGYKLLEYGTVLAWSSDLAGGNPLVLGPDYAKSNYAYKKGVADPIFAYSGNLMQYTNVLVGFTLDECKDDIAMRPYMILEGPDGEQMTIYGGIVHRSIGYIAWQNKDVFTPGSAAYNYVWEIINHVYAEVTFETNGGSAVDSVFVQKGHILEKPVDPEKEGCSFGGWYKDVALTEAFDFNNAINEDLTLYAKWDAPITRGQWIQMLVDAYGYPTDAVTDQVSYNDIADSEYRIAIETAVIYGVLTLESVEEFRPDDYATREFAAETTANCMGYQPNGTIDCEDVSEITNVSAVKQAVDSGWMELEDGYFYPNRALTQVEATRILMRIEDTFNSANDDLNEITDGIVLLDGVVNKSGPFDWETEGNQLIVPEGEDIPQVGQIITFGTEKAIRVETVENSDGKTKITYSIPEMHEYLDYIDVQGNALMDFAQFVPAEGVTVTTNTAPAIQTFGFADDWFDVPETSTDSPLLPTTTLSGSVPLGDDLEFGYSLELTIPSVSYKFDVDFDANPFNDEPAVNVKNAYVKMENDITVHVDIGSGVNTGDDSFEDTIFDDIWETPDPIPLGHVPLIGVDGLGVVLELDLVVVAEGKFELDYNVYGTMGVQVLNNRPRNISALQSSLEAGLAATLSVGPRLGLEVEIFDEDILEAHFEAGIKAEGELKRRPTGLICLGADGFVYFEIAAFEDCLIDEWLDISIGYDVWNAENSPAKISLHWEDFEKVPECTYDGTGTIKGTVANADNRTQYIEGASIQVLDNSDFTLLTSAESDSGGNYTAVINDPGTVLIRISADGYIPFDTLQSVGEGQIVYLETFLMVEGSEDSGETGVVGGRITNAVTGSGIPNAKLTIRKGWNMTSGEIVETVYTDSSGSYYVELPLGNYTIAMECEGYISSHFNAAVSALGNTDCNAVMNPDGSSSVELGDMRIILTWADEPSDLDSHLWGPTVDGESMFHTYYSNMSYSYEGTTRAYLDRDDTSYVGPETTTVYNMSPNGTYSFFIHDYTNRYSTGSTVMANSGAYVQVYIGETRVAVYHVPTSGVGNVWHVFDFDAINGRIIGVNEFSDNSNPSTVGSPAATFDLYAEPAPDKKVDTTESTEETTEETTKETTVEITEAAEETTGVEKSLHEKLLEAETLRDLHDLLMSDTAGVRGLTVDELVAVKSHAETLYGTLTEPTEDEAEYYELIVDTVAYLMSLQKSEETKLTELTEPTTETTGTTEETTEATEETTEETTEELPENTTSVFPTESSTV